MLFNSKKCCNNKRENSLKNLTNLLYLCKIEIRTLFLLFFSLMTNFEQFRIPEGNGGENKNERSKSMEKIWGTVKKNKLEQAWDPDQKEKLNILMKEGKSDICDILPELLKNDMVFFGEGHAYNSHIDNVQDIVLNMFSEWYEYMILEIPRKYQDEVNNANFQNIKHDNYKQIAQFANVLWMKIICADIDDDLLANSSNPYHQNTRDNSILEYINSQVPTWKKAVGLYWESHITEHVSESGNNSNTYNIPIKRFVTLMGEQWRSVWTIWLEVLDNEFQPSGIDFDDKQKHQFQKNFPNWCYVKTSALLDYAWKDKQKPKFDFFFVESEN